MRLAMPGFPGSARTSRTFFGILLVLWPGTLPGIRAQEGATVTEPAPEKKAALPEFSERSLMAHVRFLASEELRGRKAGTPFERITAAYIIAQLEAAGVGPCPPDSRIQEFPLRSRGSSSETPTSLNVLGWVEGADEALEKDVIVVGAHMDHLGVTSRGWFPGAEDNATGVALLLEIAAALGARREELGRSVLVVFFGAEELHMVGSRHFVEEPPIDLDHITTMVNIDMIGRPLADQASLAPLKKLFSIDDKASIGVVGALDHSFFREPIETACKEAGVQCFGTRNIPVVSTIVENLAKNRGDNAPFEAKGIPAIFFGSGESDDYHRTTDTVDKIVPALLSTRARAVYATVVALSRLEPETFPPRGPAAEEGSAPTRPEKP